MIVLEDADLGAAADAVVGGRLTNGAGQICCAVKRVLVQENVYQPILELCSRSAGRDQDGRSDLLRTPTSVP